MKLKICMLILLMSCYSYKQVIRKDKPNVILVYFDDLGYGDLGITGCTDYNTPNIDAMAKSGITFTHFYSPQAVCTASRAGLLTGCYPNRIGFSGAMDHTSRKGLAESEETIAELLKENGYKTAVFGKWHLGHHKQFLPLAHGFDSYFGIPYSNDMWPNHPVVKDYYPLTEELPFTEWLGGTITLSNDAEGCIRAYKNGKRLTQDSY